MPELPRCFGRRSDAPVCASCFAREDCPPAPNPPTPCDVQVVSEPVSGSVDAANFHLGYSLFSGQMFRWGRDRDGWWKGVTHGAVLHLRQDGDRLDYRASAAEIETYAGRMDIQAFIPWYLRIHEPPKVVVPRPDKRLRASRDRLRGFRFGRQAPFECIVSYILSVQAHMGLTKQRIRRLAGLLGDEIRFLGERYFTFPEPAKLADLSDPYYRHLRFGWRSKFLPISIRLVTETIERDYGGDVSRVDLDGWRDLVDVLYETPNSGIGLKVKKCIDLFALERLNAVPVDTWVRKMAADWYGIEGTDAAITNWAEARGRKWAGYMNEYLFIYYRELHAPALDDRVISFCESDAPSAELPFVPAQGLDAQA